jgi:hypothetical protein
METVEYTMQVPKEGKEMIDATTLLIKHFKNGGSITEAVALLSDIAQAVDGAAKIVSEMQSEGNDELGGYMTHKIWDALK